MKLYELDNEILRILWELEPDPETGEIPMNEEDLLAELSALQMERSRIMEWLAKSVLNLRSEQEALKIEEKRLHDRRIALEKKEDRLMRVMDRECNGETTDFGIATIRYRKTESIDVKDLKKTVNWLRRHKHTECIRVKEPEIDKKLVRILIKDGAKIPGTQLVQGRSCSLK